MTKAKQKADKEPVKKAQKAKAKVAAPAAAKDDEKGKESHLSGHEARMATMSAKFD